MARRKRSRKKNGFTLPIAIVAGMAGPGIKLWEARGSGSGLAREAGRIFTGYDFWNGTFDFRLMSYGTLPILMGMLVHWVVGTKLGMNRVLSRSGIPVIRI